MKIVYITPGTGGTFYCQNCMRDNELLNSLYALGHNVRKVPMYLPLNLSQKKSDVETPVFYGAINVYLKEKLPFYRHAPRWMERLFNSMPLLRFAAKKSGSTTATGLEEMTISMLQGEQGRQATELDHLIKYLQSHGKPDVVHLSNALLLGLARRLKHDLGASVVCSLQDENEWIDPMEESYQQKVWDLMAERAVDVDLFVTPSQYYADKSQKLLRIPDEKIEIIFDGINLTGYEKSPLLFDPPVIGYLCKMSEYFGLGILIDAFIKLKKDERFKDLKLHLTGGYTGDDKDFLNEISEKISNSGYENDVKIFKDFSRESRIQFLKSLTLLSVPVPSGEAFGIYLIEALAAGVPFVQPNVGCYPEILDITKGGVIYEPNDAGTLVTTIATLLADPAQVKQLGEQGREVVLGRFSIEEMANKMVKVYEAQSARSKAHSV